ncbi:glutamine--fructose-6-phosphate transaminase (isomerizing) [Pediococcus cellicola]|uniref:Glutamine--fructose-6-phosphate aminotransferase [isomerizing] n=1 Tax=Pediococcus cellicola TaxID=319652 RepID=A0A0R2INW7_9LACO|nr:glutamine--fructose-6-phosphate transaminase (isomerizing) [Pediococcus cellicola]KRN66664.1 glucosamine--fructose-6-phosphate aminotransferase [Pediococcus cellicola]GEL14692.1 glutamine--fructose-6-phosphate aminotransferase [isomerizing] [Pediococcus cellicola]
MCGIVGVTGRSDATEILISGLEKLEYRGYDSAGIYLNNAHKEDHLVKTQGKIADLKAKLTPEIKGTTGIGHTRWATNGAPSVKNAHPQFSTDERFYLVHNGVIENYEELKAQYLSDVRLVSQTDTEVVVQLVDHFVIQDQMTTQQAFEKTISLLKGSSYAFLLMDREDPETLYVAKNKSPLLIGLGKDFNVVCSDALAMLNVTKDFLELHDGEMVVVTPKTVKITNQSGQRVERKAFHVDLDPKAADRGAYPYYMLKEIDEQPAVLHRIQETYLQDSGIPVLDQEMLNAMAKADRIYIVGAGTSYHAGLVGQTLFEKLAQVPTQAVLASEFAYTDPILSKHPFFIFLTQSGETADSRQVLVRVNEEWQAPSLTITNVENSTLYREASYQLLLQAGPEIAVASTKAYTAQIAVEAVVAKALGTRKQVPAADAFDLQHELSLAANAIQAIVDDKAQIKTVAHKDLATTRNAFYIGRGVDYFVALEAALKLKEISYIQAEGFASGELKHGTIALIEDQTPVIALITQARTASHTRGNIQEVQSRGAQVLTIVSENLAKTSDQLVIPSISELLMPLISVVPAQLLAYYASLERGYNVDQPRNLAKSVTVE